MQDTGKPATARFDTCAGFEAQFRACLDAAQVRLDLFDPDFAVFPLGSRDTDAALRTFLGRGGMLRLAMHSPGHIERHYPRLLRLLRDHGHAIECRATPKALHDLTDSFCIVDNRHVLRRFHSDHMRGEMAFDTPDSLDIPRHRFEAIWAESRPTLQPSIAGL